MNAKLAMAVIATIVVVAVGAAAIDRSPRRAALPDPELGARVYADNCAACHGANLQGQPNWRERNAQGRLPAPPHDATGHTWHHPDDYLFAVTRDGGQAHAPADFKSNMPGFGEQLATREIWAVLAYIKSTWPPQIQDRQARVNAQAN